jgi:single-stranded DNA-binding protein
MNTFTISGGRLVKDAEVKKTKDGRDYLVFTVATNDVLGDKEKSLFFNCTSSEPASISQYLKKGKQVDVVGFLRDNTYLNKDSVKIHGVSFTVLKTNIVWGNSDGDNKGGNGGGYQKKPYNKPSYQKPQTNRDEQQEPQGQQEQQRDEGQEFSDSEVPF